MTLNYYIEEIKLLLRQNKDERVLDDRYLETLLNSQRALFIKNEVNGGKTVESNVTQTIGCLELESVSKPRTDGDKSLYLKTIKKIPKPINFKERLGIESLRINGEIGSEITLTRKDMIEYTGTQEYDSKDIYGYYDGYLYIKVPKNNFKAGLITHLELDAVFETPTFVEFFVDCKGNVYYDRYMDDYPINHAIWEYVLNGIITKLQIPLSIRETIENDDRKST